MRRFNFSRRLIMHDRRPPHLRLRFGTAEISEAALSLSSFDNPFLMLLLPPPPPLPLLHFFHGVMTIMNNGK